jgi:hypothetical protein
MNLDLTLRVEAPTRLTEKSSAEEKIYYERLGAFQLFDLSYDHEVHY